MCTLFESHDSLSELLKEEIRQTLRRNHVPEIDFSARNKSAAILELIGLLVTGFAQE